MCLFFSFIPATFFVLVGFFVLYLSKKSGGGLRIFGIILAIWIFIIAALFPIGGIYMTLSLNCPMMKMMQNTEFPIWKEHKD